MVSGEFPRHSLSSHISFSDANNSVKNAKTQERYEQHFSIKGQTINSIGFMEHILFFVVFTIL